MPTIGHISNCGQSAAMASTRELGLYNPYDHRDVYECQNCGRVTSKDAGPSFQHIVVVACCGSPQAWTGSSREPAFGVGDVIDCPTHGSTKVVSIKTEQTKGSPVATTPGSSASATSTSEFGPGAALLGGLLLGGVVGLVLGWIPMLILGGPYFLWVVLSAVVLGLLAMAA